MDEYSPLSHDYVEHIFKKLAVTLAKYKNIVPSIEELNEALEPHVSNTSFAAIMHVIHILKSHAETSKIADEIYQNVKRDFWHTQKPGQISIHPGKYYIDSVAD